MPTLLNVIPKARPDHPSLDYEVLRAEGLRHLEGLATEMWTDFNVHDPGITLLEVLCYAITDLGYRTRMLPLGDLFLGEAGDKPAFFLATEILPSAPVTARDFRKLLIDVEGVKNAWVGKSLDPVIYHDQQTAIVLTGERTFRFREIGAYNTANDSWTANPEVIRSFLKQYAKSETVDEALVDTINKWVVNGLNAGNLPSTDDECALAHALVCRFGYFPLKKEPRREQVKDRTIVLNGLMQITLDLDDDFDPDNTSQCRPVVERVMRRLQANRFLGHDYVEPPVIVGKRPLAICLHLEAADDANELDAAIDAVWRIEQHLRPTPQFYTFRQQLERGYPVEAIYNGPLLDHGFLDNEQLAGSQLRSVVYHSDLTNAATAHPGVKTVHELKLRFYPEATYTAKPAYTIFEAGQRPLKPVIDLCASCVFVTRRGVRHELPEHRLAEGLRLRRLLAGCHDEVGGLPLPIGQPRPDLTAYRSVQYDLPANYGVGEYEATDGLPAGKRAARKQLQAFLAIFDQLLASYLQQLGEVRKLLSVNQDVDGATYPAADLSAIPGMAELLDRDRPFEGESEFARLERRNRLLDHMLARFGETFTDYVVALVRGDSAPEEDFHEQHRRTFLAGKADFLRELPRLAANRGRAYNYRGPEVWNTENVAGVKKRVHRRLGLAGSGNAESLLAQPAFRLDVVPTRGARGVVQHQIVLRVLPDQLPPNAPAPPYGGLLLHSGRFNSLRNAQDRRDELYSLIWNADAFEEGAHPRETSESAARFVVDGKAELYSDPMGPSEAAELTRYVRDLIRYQRGADREGFHVVEHILLRPNDPDDRLLELSLGCDLRYTPLDPYSSWITVVVPDWPEKFARPGFREFFEQTFRHETPAELAVRFCWVGVEALRAFEEAYVGWMEAKARCTPDECHVTAALNELVAWLNAAACTCVCPDEATTKPACAECKDCPDPEALEAPRRNTIDKSSKI